MISRRWDPGIGEDDWVVVIYQDHKMDYGNQGIYSARLGIVLGIKKGICRRLRIFRSVLNGDGVHKSSKRNYGSFQVVFSILNPYFPSYTSWRLISGIKDLGLGYYGFFGD